MARHTSKRSSPVSFWHACTVLEGILSGGTRRGIVADALGRGSFDDALRHLRGSLSSHVLHTESGRLDLSAIVRVFDRRARAEGFHVLHAWDFGRHRFSEENIPVLMLDYFSRERTGREVERESLALLLDYYLLHILALVAMRAWEEEDASQCIDHVGELLDRLNGPDGSGRPLVADPHSLLFLAVSHFHPDEHAYDRLLEKVRTLEEGHPERFAHAVAAILGPHLRWGFEVLYHRDLVRMRADNVGDYPWLLFALSVLMRKYVRLRSAGADQAAREPAVEDLLNGLTADPWAFLDAVPAALSPHEAEHSELRGLLRQHRDSLLEEFARHRPSPNSFSPVAVHYNFPHNVLVAIATIALLEDDVPVLPFNALLTREAWQGGAADEQWELARRLVAYCEASPGRLGEHGALLIVYEPHAGLNSYILTRNRLRKLDAP